MAGTVAMAIVSIGSTAYSTASAKSAARKAGAEAKRLAGLDAADQDAATAESARRMKMEMEGEESLALARAAASGTDIEGSTSNLFLQTLSGENKAQLDWLKRSGLAASARIREGGASAARTAKSEGDAITASGLATAANTGAGAYQNWYTNQQAVR